MKWLIDNWTLLVVIAVVLFLIYQAIKKFAALPTEEQQKKVREFLLYVVIQCEKELGSGTGRAKLSKAYSMFIEHFPALVSIIPFELFSVLVDDALEEMRELLKNNSDIKAYVEGE